MPRAKNPNPKSRVVSNKAALSALATLIQYGRQSFKKEYQHDRGIGTCLGLALSKCELGNYAIFTTAADALEDQNFHALSSAIRKLRDGDYRVDMHNTIIIHSDD